MSGAEPRVLSGGLLLRAATEDDVDALVALYVKAFGAQDGPDVRAFAAEPDVLASWSVVMDRDTMASAIGRIDHRMQLDGLEFTAAQIEYVATNPDYQRRGLVAAQMEWHHDACRADDVPLLMIGGIPYFYRRFGYGYGIDAPTLFLFDREQVRTHDASSVRVRDAIDTDLDAILRLERERPTEGLRVLRAEREWRRAIAMCRPNQCAHLLVAESRGNVVGWSRVFDHPNEGRTFLLPSVASNADAVTALVQASLDRAEDRMLIGFDSPGTAFAEQLRALGTPFEYGLGYYARIPDPIGFLEMLRPLLSARLAGSDLVDLAGTLEISLYNAGIAIDFIDGSVSSIRSIPGVEDPTDTDGIGVAPDWFPALVLGRWKATELARRVDDVIIARDHHLMNVLFPQRSSDVAGDF
jgi:predicted N-acetyltransferase YhbS